MEKGQLRIAFNFDDHLTSSRLFVAVVKSSFIVVV